MAPTGFAPARWLTIREQLSYLKMVKLLGPPVRSPSATATVPVLLVPGFMAGDWSLVPLSRWLRRNGYATYQAGMALNAGCTTETADRLERRLERLVARSGRPVAIVGQSRGGTLAKLVAVRRPDFVAGLITLGSPNVNPLAAAPNVLKLIERLVWLNRAGARWVLGEECIRGSCAAEVDAQLRSPFPEHIPYTAVFSRNDGIVDWRACLDPDAEHIEVSSSHIGMGTDRKVLRIVERRLAELSA